MILLDAQIVAGALLAGFVQGASGFAFALIATAIWIWLVDPHLLVPLIVICSLIGNVFSIHSVREHLDLSRARPFLIGGAIGVPIGIAIFSLINQDVFKFGVGAILIAYCSAMLLLPNMPAVKAGGAFADGCVGVLSGVMGGLGGLSGPAPIIWCTLRGWSKNVQRATFQPLFMLIGSLTLTVHVFAGTITKQTLQVAALVAPAVMLSSWVGARAHHHIPDRAFRKMLLLLLFASGLTLVVPPVLKLLHAIGLA